MDGYSQKILKYRYFMTMTILNGLVLTSLAGWVNLKQTELIET